MELLAAGTGVKLVLMSATVDVEKFVNYFNGCPRIDVPGGRMPVIGGPCGRPASDAAPKLKCRVTGYLSGTT